MTIAITKLAKGVDPFCGFKPAQKLRGSGSSRPLVTHSISKRTGPNNRVIYKLALYFNASLMQIFQEKYEMAKALVHLGDKQIGIQILEDTGEGLDYQEFRIRSNGGKASGSGLIKFDVTEFGDKFYRESHGPLKIQRFSKDRFLLTLPDSE